jgi:hypothetical protein
MVEEFNNGLQRSMAPDGQHCLFPNVMPWSHILHAAAYTIISTEVGCRVHDVDWDSSTGECLIVAGAAGGLCKTLSSSRQLLHLKCVASACRSRCDIPVVEQYSQTLLHQLQALAEVPPLGVNDPETEGIVDTILTCDTCSVLTHTLLLLPLDVPSTVSTLVIQTTALLHRATLVQAVMAVLWDSSPSSPAGSILLSAAARVCAVAESGGSSSPSEGSVGWARFLLSFSRSMFDFSDASEDQRGSELLVWTSRSAPPPQALSDEGVLEWSMSCVYARLLQFLRVALTCRVLLLGDAGLTLDNAGLGNGISMLLYGEQLTHLLQLPQLHLAPPLTEAERRWLSKCRSLAIPARAPAKMMLPSLHRLPDKFEQLLLEGSTHLCRCKNWLCSFYVDLTLFFQCSKSGKVPHEPAICLLCGRWLCASHNRCCYDANTRIGAVTGKNLSPQLNRSPLKLHLVHTRACSHAAGPFLMAKSSMLLCVADNAGSLLPAPYLDAWGEEVRLAADGVSLSLHLDLQIMWLSCEGLLSLRAYRVLASSSRLLFLTLLPLLQDLQHSRGRPLCPSPLCLL